MVGIISIFIIIYILIEKIAKYETHDQIRDRMDADPNNRIKSNKWIAANPEEYKKIWSR